MGAAFLVDLPKPTGTPRYAGVPKQSHTDQHDQNQTWRDPCDTQRKNAVTGYGDQGHDKRSRRHAATQQQQDTSDRPNTAIANAAVAQAGRAAMIA